MSSACWGREEAGGASGGMQRYERVFEKENNMQIISQRACAAPRGGGPPSMQQRMRRTTPRPAASETRGGMLCIHDQSRVSACWRKACAGVYGGAQLRCSRACGFAAPAWLTVTPRYLYDANLLHQNSAAAHPVAASGPRRREAGDMHVGRTSCPPCAPASAARPTWTARPP